MSKDVIKTSSEKIRLDSVSIAMQYLRKNVINIDFSFCCYSEKMSSGIENLLKPQVVDIVSLAQEVIGNKLVYQCQGGLEVNLKCFFQKQRFASGKTS